MGKLEVHARKINLVLGIGFCTLFLIYFPKTIGIEDEVGFFNLAHIWSKGFLKINEVFLHKELLHDFVKVSDWFAPTRNPGRSLLTLPFYLFGIPTWAFLSSLLVQIGIFWMGRKSLTLNGLSPLYAFLFLLHPTLSLFSRAMMGDGLAGLLILATYYYYQKRKTFLSGLSLGLAAVVRYHAALILPFLLLLIFLRDRKDIKQPIKFLIPVGVLGLSLVAYNYYIYLNPLVSPGKMGAFGAQYFFQNFPFYLIALNAIYPLMLIAPFFKKELRLEYSLLVIPFLMFFSCYYFYDKRPSFFETMVLGPRLFQVAIPLCILFYIRAIDGVIQKLFSTRRPLVLLMAMTIGFLGNLMMFSKHQKYLNQFLQVKAEVQRVVPENATIVGNSTLRKLFSVPSFNPYRYELFPFDFMNELIEPDARLRSKRSWYLVLLKKHTGNKYDIMVKEYAKHHQLAEIHTDLSGLMIYKVN